MHGADIVTSRESCLRCRRPKAACLCPTLPPMETASRVVLLMHPKEYKRQKTGTGRLACINLAKAEKILDEEGKKTENDQPSKGGAILCQEFSGLP